MLFLLTILPPDMYSRKYSGMHASTSNYTYGIVIPPLDPEIATLAHITTVGTSSLWETSLTPVTLTQQSVSTTSLPASLVAHLHTPSTLLGHPLWTPSSLVASSVATSGPVTSSFIFPPPNQGVNPMTVPQIVPHTPGGHVTTGGPPSSVVQYPTGGKPSAMGQFPTGGKPSVAGQVPVGGKPSVVGQYSIWGQQQPRGKPSSVGKQPPWKQQPTWSQQPVGGKQPVWGQQPVGGKQPIWGQQPVGGKPTRGQQPVWGQSHTGNPPHPWGKNVLENPTGIYSGLPYLGVPNTPWGQPNPQGIPPQGYFPTQP
jgi:hypothetical protein